LVPIGMQLLPGGLFTLGLFFVPESPRWLALNEVRKARQLGTSSYPSSHPSKADIAAAAGEAAHIEKLAQKKEEIEVTSPTAEQDGPILEIAPQIQETTTAEVQGKTRSLSPSASHFEPATTHLYGSLARRIVAPSSPRSAPNASEAMCSLAYLRSLPLSSPELRAEMAEVYAQLEEAEEERRSGKGNLYEELKKMSNWKRLATGSFVGAWQIWTGQTAILYYASVAPSRASYDGIYSDGKLSAGPLPWVYGSEIFPTHLRDAGHLVFVCITWSNNFAVAKLTPMGFAGIGWVLWMIYGSFNLGGALICWLICPETKGKSMEEYDMLRLLIHGHYH
ncbi:hypothetical protein FRB90_004106, partial [Tulasnella sp. 427]